MSKPDYSAWLTPERLEHEEQLWARQGAHKFFAECIAAAAAQERLYPNCRILELGCGTGFVPLHLPATWSYLGIDANELCLAKAYEKNPDRSFCCLDVRQLALGRFRLDFDLVAAFAFFKHFMPAEWAGVLRLALAMAPTAVFSMPIAEADLENGVDFPHTFVTRATLESAVASAHHRIVETRIYSPGTAVEPVFITRRE
jgi:SAM-dependent methyltransferase